MLGALAAVLCAASPVAPLEALAPELMLAAKKKKPKSKPAEETSEGLDLSEPAPNPAPEPAPAAEPVVAEEKPAEAVAPAGWSIVTPRTIGEAQNGIEGGVGWPGVYAGYWRGILSTFDVGAKVGFNWGYEGQVTRPVPGLRIQAQARYLFLDNDKISVGVSFSPGALIYFIPGSTRGGILLPVAGTVGLHFLNFVAKLNLSATLEIPFFVLFGLGASIPFVAGANAEYFITDSLLVFARIRPLGIAIWTNGAGVFYTFEANVGVGYHL